MVQSSTQFTVFLENRPGRLAAICAELAKSKVSIQAMTVMDSHENSVLRFVVDNPAAAREAVKRLSLTAAEAEVLLVELRHQPGAIGQLCERLAAQHVNIDYIYCSAGGKNGKTIAVLRATPANKVRTILDDASSNGVAKTERAPVRRSPVRKG